MRAEAIWMISPIRNARSMEDKCPDSILGYCAAIGAMTGVVAGGVGASPVAVAGGAYASISKAIDQWKN